jgi:glycosyltransferase involved in cell wall biosynthesis
VVLEAGVCGIPVLLTDQCGFDAVSVANGGMVVPASAEGIGKGLELLLNDKNKLKLMGQILRKYVQDNFTWRIAAEKYLRLSRAVLAIPAQGEALQPAKSQPASPNPIN